MQIPARRPLQFNFALLRTMAAVDLSGELSVTPESLQPVSKAVPFGYLSPHSGAPALTVTSAKASCPRDPRQLTL